MKMFIKNGESNELINIESAKVKVKVITDRQYRHGKPLRSLGALYDLQNPEHLRMLADLIENIQNGTVKP